MADKPELLSSGAGLGAAVAVETGAGLGEGVEAVAARGYWEQVWRRFRHDKAAVPNPARASAVMASSRLTHMCTRDSRPSRFRLSAIKFSRGQAVNWPPVNGGKIACCVAL